MDPNVRHVLGDMGTYWIHDRLENYRVRRDEVWNDSGDLIEERGDFRFLEGYALDQDVMQWAKRWQNHPDREKRREFTGTQEIEELYDRARKQIKKANCLVQVRVALHKQRDALLDGLSRFKRVKSTRQLVFDISVSQFRENPTMYNRLIRTNVLPVIASVYALSRPNQSEWQGLLGWEQKPGHKGQFKTMSGQSIHNVHIIADKLMSYFGQIPCDKSGTTIVEQHQSQWSAFDNLFKEIETKRMQA